MRDQCFLVTGATGAVGKPLVRYLLDEGYGVRVLVRDRSKASLLPAGLEIVWGDLENGGALQEATYGVDFVFHLAAATGDSAGKQGFVEMFQRVNVEGTENLLRAAAGNSVSRFVFFSTIDVYGKSLEYEADENSDTNPGSIYARTKLEAEKLVQGFCSDSGMGGIILRLSAVYGPHMGGNYLKMVKALGRRMFVPIGDGLNRRTLVFERDASRAAVLAALSPGAAGRVFNVSDGDVHTVRQILEAICEAMGRRPPCAYLPKSPTIAAASAIDCLMTFIKKPSHFAEALEKFATDISVKAERIQDELGFQPVYDIKRGWRETIETWKIDGFLSSGL
jgi:UDP-glucose 4-epimerase